MAHHASSAHASPAHTAATTITPSSTAEHHTLLLLLPRVPQPTTVFTHVVPIPSCFDSSREVAGMDTNPLWPPLYGETSSSAQPPPWTPKPAHSSSLICDRARTAVVAQGAATAVPTRARSIPDLLCFSDDAPRCSSTSLISFSDKFRESLWSPPSSNQSCPRDPPSSAAAWSCAPPHMSNSLSIFMLGFKLNDVYICMLSTC